MGNFACIITRADPCCRNLRYMEINGILVQCTPLFGSSLSVISRWYRKIRAQTTYYRYVNRIMMHVRCKVGENLLLIAIRYTQQSKIFHNVCLFPLHSQHLEIPIIKWISHVLQLLMEIVYLHMHRFVILLRNVEMLSGPQPEHLYHLSSSY